MAKISSIVQAIPWVPLNKLKRWMEAADWLLLLGNRGGVQVPSKLYDYPGMRKPILMLQETPDDEASQIIASVDAGWIVNNNEHSIVQFFKSFLENTLRYPSFRDSVRIETFLLEASLERYWRIIQRVI